VILHSIRRRPTGLLALVVMCAIAGSAGRAAEPTAAEFAHAFQKRIEGIHDFSADFVHVYEAGALRKQVTERGKLLVKKPGRMRW